MTSPSSHLVESPIYLPPDGVDNFWMYAVILALVVFIIFVILGIIAICREPINNPKSGHMMAQASSIQMHTSSVYVPHTTGTTNPILNKNHNIKYQRHDSFTKPNEFLNHSPASSVNEYDISMMQND